MTTDLRVLDARAVRAGVDVVRRATPEDLGRATPCAGWTLRDLLSHMTVQHHGFAAASRGQGADPRVWRIGQLDDDPVQVYVDAAERVLTAFAEEGVLDREFTLPEISASVPFPASRAIGFHLVDYVAHGWDVARTLDVPFVLDDEVIGAALQIAQQVPDGEARLVAGAAFAPVLLAPVLPASVSTSTLDGMLALLGRSPSWPG